MTPRTHSVPRGTTTPNQEEEVPDFLVDWLRKMIQLHSFGKFGIYATKHQGKIRWNRISEESGFAEDFARNGEAG